MGTWPTPMTRPWATPASVVEKETYPVTPLRLVAGSTQSMGEKLRLSFKSLERSRPTDRGPLEQPRLRHFDLQ